ncbi:MAG: hypothetical protein K8H84_03410 [Sulfuricella denitrificans]|nr:hypothetical protein [Sulfuricella denitrificans]
MFRKYILKPAVWHRNPLEFEWDPESGEVRGADAGQVIAMAASAVKEGSVTGHPYPTSYDITDPLHNISEMAVLLGQDWMLSEDLASAYPEEEEADDQIVMIDKDGVEHVKSGKMLH